MLALTQNTYPLQRIQVYFSVEQLVVIIVVKVPLWNYPVHVRGIAYNTCK